MNLIDTHAHIYLDDFKTDLEGVIDRARLAGVQTVLMPNIDQSSCNPMLEVEKSYPDFVHSMIGLHPCSVKQDFKQQLEFIENELHTGKYIAVGEIGTDLYWDRAFWEEQKEALIFQLTLADQFALPSVIHCRESLDETIDIIESAGGRRKGVFHCFSGSSDQAQRITRMGWYLGIGGVSTFKNSGMAKTLSDMDMDYVVLETDSPYLAPVPNRGKRNEPGFLKDIAVHLASARNVSLDEVAQITTRNAKRLFGLK